MTLPGDVAHEIAGMFAGDTGLAFAILAIVAVAAGLIKLTAIDPLVGGGVLLFGSILGLIANVLRAARARP